MITPDSVDAGQRCDQDVTLKAVHTCAATHHMATMLFFPKRLASQAVITLPAGGSHSEAEHVSQATRLDADNQALRHTDICISPASASVI